MMRPLLIVFAALFFLSGSAMAQQAVIRGFVTDEATEQPLQGATVVLRSGEQLIQGAATDGDGYFIINRVRPGAYSLVISFIGYADFAEDFSIVAGDVLERIVALRPATGTIDELVVEAEAEGGVTAVAAGLESIVPSEIQRVPVPGVSGDLAGYLQTVPGVVVQGDRGGQFFVRGGAVDQNLALLDGLPVYMPFHILSVYSAFPEELVDRAQFYTGGFGAKYGTRVSSILDVRARNGNKQNLAGSVSVAPFLSSATVEGPLWKGRLSFVASIRESLIERIMPDMFGQRMPYRFGDRFAKIHGLLGSSHAFSFTFLDTEDRGDIAGTKKTVFGEAEEASINDSTEVGWTNRVYGGTYTYRSNALPIIAEVTAGVSEMTNEFGPETSPERESGISSVDVKGHLTWLLRKGEVTIGSTYRESDLTLVLDDLFQDYSSTTQQLKELSSYAEGKVDMLDGRLSLQPGIHLYSLPDRSENYVEPRFRASFWPAGKTGRHQINASWGMYHQRIAGLSDERDLGNIFYAWVAGQEDVKATAAMHSILGYNIQIQPWISAAVEGYYKGYDQLSVPIFSPFPQFTTSLQEASGRAFGIDARVNLENREFILDSILDGFVSYAYSNVEYETDAFTYHPSHDRRHQLNALMHAQKGEIGITVQWQYGSGLPFTESSGFDVWYLLTPDVDVSEEVGIDRIMYSKPFGGRQPTYSRVDVWLERKVEKGRYVGTLRAGAMNLFNRQNLFYYDLFTFQRVDQLPLIPSVGFKLEFR
ncbi:MAG: TonB-dependent receptor [Bacteroidetes Order II. Incertae sedis bacterium]|jgi:hypothetical protein|nr:TonB-dependent receptor [Bacteroidetes Order II. bacterium]MBT4603798.1 TonB-dependent receptor [Bacteroidetes Order II. bacterium]MBT5250433.1 TonB-dependent receptor [Bacteroidetes Order II. bacterium]MBT6199775.1 TonB-dependent receptor [Bacteroidetes Order II. bacterium]MBT6424630.1 TonB-dependent receptor [Bacteroidetes Order II. bacterium]